MLSIQQKLILEKIAIKMREVLEISPEIILTPKYKYELIAKINSKIEGVEVVINGGPVLVMKKDNTYTISLKAEEKKEFYEMLRMLALAILLKKRESSLQKETLFFTIPRENREAAEYLMLAFVMPKETFRNLCYKYSSAEGSFLNIEEMSRELDIDGEYLVARASNLGMF